MTINTAIRAIAGTFVIISVILAMYVDQAFLYFTLFVGVNLLQSSITKWCMMEKILAKFGLKNSEGDSCSV
jgi:hypothetical protein